MTSRCEQNVPSQRGGWLIEALVLCCRIKSKGGAKDTIHSVDLHPRALQMTTFGRNLRHFVNARKRSTTDDSS